ncbi:unnamed protein product [Parnassius apollo]|uniref:(apollo) hypothetical protein n=1 Tax=Parnassius apollo TaxID=110799 RepID=A0A8S3Y0D4_PARAO|nr:unnamed protein product [Parnassius apollo]
MQTWRCSASQSNATACSRYSWCEPDGAAPRRRTRRPAVGTAGANLTVQRLAGERDGLQSVQLVQTWRCSASQSNATAYSRYSWCEPDGAAPRRRK